MTVANKNAIQKIDTLDTFTGSNTFAVNEAFIYEDFVKHNSNEYDGYENLYVVYSYGYHFPMYIYDRQAGMWIGNEDSYSVSTTRHQSQCRPSEGVECWLHTSQMKDYITCGSMMRYMERNARQEVAFIND